MYVLQGKIIIITGGARGLGRKFAEILLEYKANGVTITDINEDALAETHKELAEKYGQEKILSVVQDVADKESWEKVWNETERHFQTSVDVLINNAGIGLTKNWELSYNIMIHGTTAGSMYALSKMGVNNGSGSGGRIINIASMAGLVTGLSPLAEASYSVSKHAIVALTKSFAKHEENNSLPGTIDGVKCYTLCPWFVDTQMVRDIIEVHKLEKKIKRRVMTADEVGDALIKAFEIDENGRCFIVFPDAPLVSYPNHSKLTCTILITLGKIAKKFGINPTVITGSHFILALIVLFIVVHLFYWFLF